MTPNHPTSSLSFKDCHMTPKGIGAMAEHLRSLPFFQAVPEPRVRAVAIALIAFGGSLDGLHRVCESHYPAPDAYAENVRTNRPPGLLDEYMRLIMDLLTWYDRISGGASFLVSTPANHPGNPPTITEVNMDVFLPTILQEQPRTGIVFARMVQYFAEEIGLPAVQRAHKAKPTKHQRLPIGAASAASPGDIQPLIPPSETPWHKFYGRDSGVLERLIAEQASGLGIVPKMPSTISRTLPSSQAPSPEGVAPRTTVLHQGAARTVGDIGRFVRQFERCNENDEAGRRAIMEQVSTRLPDVFNVILDLERRVKTLETINETQLVEIWSLQQALEESADQRNEELMRINTELSSASRLSLPSSGVAGTGSASVAEPSISELPRPLLPLDKSESRLAHVKHSSRTVTSSSMTLPNSSISYFAPRKSMPVHASAPPHASTPNSSTRQSSPNASPSPSQAVPHNLGLSKGRIFGPNTEQVLIHHQLPRRTHTLLRYVEMNFQGNWMEGVHTMVPNCSQDLARELVVAMEADCRLSTA
ncbi:hypothetical protein GSI_04109 [Ganoderma sinense ZZ0214-1]|uniref:Uncharacterized protein n=1 Tax=Ganoderma sinense ZZ0214-1 TaxID=1077348 RepID=A0A2G8SI92_9APHY|nr:hypothetical protein GSI_04109 [Ganoderma sinense ZZ0214-1]